jgi:di/tricarboxylate transporter
MYLVGVEREGELLAPVPPAHELRGGDLLSFAGQVDRVVELQRTPGLVFEENHHIDALDGAHGWFEVVVGPGSSLVGQTIKEAGFRSRYQAAVVALHRSGSPVDGRLGDARVRVGDALLVVADSGFRDRWKDRSDFLLIRGRSEAPPALTWMAPLSLLILAGVAGLPLIGLVSVLKAAVLGAVAMVLAGVLTPRQARDSVDLNVVLLIAAAIGIGAGAESIGIPSRLADVLLSSFGQFGLWGSALGIVIASLLLTELVSNAAAVALVVPMAVRAAEQSGGDVRLFALGATLAASASFLTPIGYQTNTMVYGPGRYHFADYLRLGIPLTLVVVIIMPVMMSLD